MFSSVLQGILIGLGAAVPIGQVNVEIARRTLRGGFLPGVAVGAGASSIDVMYATFSAFGVGVFLANPHVSLVLGYVAVVVLVYLGVQCLRAGLARKMVSIDPLPVADDKTLQYESKANLVAVELPRPTFRAGYVTGLAMTVFNPLTIAFWFLTLPGIAGPVSRTALLPIAAGVFVGTMSWVLFFAGTLSIVRRFKSGGWMRVADIAGGITLLLFAVKTFLRSIGVHL